MSEYPVSLFPQGCGPPLPAGQQIEYLQKEIASLQKKNERLQAENARLREENTMWKRARECVNADMEGTVPYE